MHRSGWRSYTLENEAANVWHNATGSVRKLWQRENQPTVDSTGSAVPSSAAGAMLHHVSVNEVRRRHVK